MCASTQDYGHLFRSLCFNYIIRFVRSSGTVALQNYKYFDILSQVRTPILGHVLSILKKYVKIF